MNVNTTEQDFKLNIALKYSIIEDILSIIIFKCTFKVRLKKISIYKYSVFLGRKFREFVLKNVFIL